MDALDEWLNTAIMRKNVHFAVTNNYEGPNRLIVEGRFCIEGYKIHDTAGYELSFVKTGEKDIQDAIAAFTRVFNRARRGRAAVTKLRKFKDK